MVEITVEDKTYKVYSNHQGSLNHNPHIVDNSTGNIPDNQMRILKQYLHNYGISPLDYNSKTTHELIHWVIKLNKTQQKKAESKTILQLNSENLELVEKMIEDDPKYGPEQKLIESVLTRFPDNNNIEIVAMKIGVIDITNSTRLFQYKQNISLYDLSELIVNQIENFNKRIESGDSSLISEISKKTKTLYGRNLFSFASKYCHYHNRFLYKKDDFSIFDTIVKEKLPVCFYDITANNLETWRETSNYEAYNDYIENKLDELNISNENRRRKFDHYFWYLNR